MSAPVLELVDTGLGSSLQDAGRVGWKRFGVPPGGALDDHAACAANRLVGNPEDCSLLEVLLQGVRVRALVPIDLAVTGAAFGDHHEGGWRVHRLQTGEEFTVPPPPRGVWSYLAVPGGFDGERWFGSVSIFPRGGLGQPLVRGSLLHRLRVPSDPPSAVAGRWWDPQEQRNYSRPPALRVWRGPQWEAFSPAARAAFFETPWTVSARSDRTGYRLEGPPVESVAGNLASEPVIPGSVQIPSGGQPLVTLRDGPTVGGYPKLGLVDPADLSWLVQCRPGQEVRFVQMGP